MSLEQTACDVVLVVVSVCTAIAAWHWLTDPLTAVVSLAQSLWNHPFFFFTSLLLVVLVVVSVCTAIAAWHWLTDPLTAVVSLAQSLWNHPFFFFTSLLLVFLFTTGIHRRVIAPSIITARTRTVLSDFNMSCDETGKLILKPRPANS